MDLAQVHQELLRAHEEILTDPTGAAEWLENASCPPHVKHLAQLASGAAMEGFTAERWRSWILDGVGPEAAPSLESAEACMRSAGLWPWHDGTVPSIDG